MKTILLIILGHALWPILWSEDLFRWINGLPPRAKDYEPMPPLSDWD